MPFPKSPTTLRSTRGRFLTLFWRHASGSAVLHHSIHLCTSQPPLPPALPFHPAFPSPPFGVSAIHNMCGKVLRQRDAKFRDTRVDYKQAVERSHSAAPSGLGLPTLK